MNRADAKSLGETMGPLTGLRVIERSGSLSGSYCTKLLADFGAAVIKVERPRHGDGARTLGPFPHDIPDPEKSGLFLYLNTNKHGITLDLGTPRGREVFIDLVRQWRHTIGEL